MAKAKEKATPVKPQEENEVPQTQQEAEQPIVHQPAEVKAASKSPASNAYQEPVLKRGEALVVAVDAEGNETDLPFVTDIKSYEKYYSGSYFLLKKKY